MTEHMNALMSTPLHAAARVEDKAVHVATVLRVHGLCKQFTLHLRHGLVLPVLNKVSFEVAAGECLALVGPSGQGKSTVMKCLYGSYHLDGGSACLRRDDGTDIELRTASAQTMRRLRERDIAYVSQFLRAAPRVSALDVVAERWLNSQPPSARIDRLAASQDALPQAVDRLDATDEATQAARAAAAELLARLNLPSALWDLPPATFSGGEQQRVNIARGFIAPARLLLLDEPTASLDAVNRRVVIELIEQAKARGTAVIGIFHDEEVRDAVATRCHPLSQD